jgi:hypothetical protein
MEPSLREQARLRAHGRCEYCRIPEFLVRLPFQIDHIIAKQHGGETRLSNSSYCCMPCNKNKGPNLSGRDPKTKKIVPLFHPRRHKWDRHFRRDGPYIHGRTPKGRATVLVLNMNAPVYVAVRQALIEEGVFPERPRRAFR